MKGDYSSEIEVNEVVEAIRNWMASNWWEIQGGATPGIDGLAREILSLCYMRRCHHLTHENGSALPVRHP